MEEFIKFVEACGGPRKAGERLGRSRQSVYQIMNGERRMTVALAKQIEHVSIGRFKARDLLDL